MGRPVGGGGAAPTPAPAPNGGRMPGAPERVGCGPRRSPGRMGGRFCPGVNCPVPVLDPTACPDAGAGRSACHAPAFLRVEEPRGRWARTATAAAPAYTGRGPVCGTINLRGGGVPLGARRAVCGCAGAWETASSLGAVARDFGRRVTVVALGYLRVLLPAELRTVQAQQLRASQLG